jgi:DNA-binding NtrC family response regulator
VRVYGKNGKLAIEVHDSGPGLTGEQLHPIGKNSGRWTDQAPLEVAWQANVGDLEKALVERALRQTDGNKSKAVELLGIHRRLLYEKMREFGIE